jgi:hypothetical protein
MKLKMMGIVMGAMAATAFTAAPSAFAAQNLMKACKKELKKFDCSATTEQEAFQCLQQHEKEGAKHEGFSRGCHKAHESYEKKMGKEEAPATPQAQSSAAAPAGSGTSE